MSAPFFDKSGTSTVFPGDGVIINLPDGKHVRAFLRRVWMQALDIGGFEPFGEVQYHDVINAMPTARMTKCVRYFGEEYASVAALEYSQCPLPGMVVLVWSTKLGKMVAMTISAVDDDICLVSYKGVQYEAPTADVYVKIERKKSDARR